MNPFRKLPAKAPVQASPRQPRLTSAPLALVVAHFNWAGWSRPVEHLRRFLRQQRAAGLPVYLVEAVAPGQASIATEPDLAMVEDWHAIRVEDSGILWQKEALWNIGARRVPACHPVIACVDADVWFERPDWADECAKQILDGWRMSQPFSVCRWTHRDGILDRVRQSVGAMKHLDLEFHAHPGFAWAAHREFWEVVGGYWAHAPIGHGDTLHSSALLGLREPVGNSMPAMGGATGIAAWRDYAKRLREWVGDAWGATPGALWHEWHGDRGDRHYATRGDKLKRMNAQRDLELAPDGSLRWTAEAPQSIRAAVRKYFTERKEDG